MRDVVGVDDVHHRKVCVLLGVGKTRSKSSNLTGIGRADAGERAGVAGAALRFVTRYSQRSIEPISCMV